MFPRIVAVLTGVLISPLAISRIGVHGFGLWVLATQIPSIVLSPDFGLTQALITELSLMQRERRNLRDARSRLAHLSRLLWVVACLWLVVGLVAAAVYSMIGVNAGRKLTPFCRPAPGGQDSPGSDNRGKRGDSFTLFAAFAVALLICIAGIPALVWSRAQLAQERQPRPGSGHRPQPMPPHPAAAGALIAWGRDLQPGRVVSQRQMCEASQHRVMTSPLPTAARTPVVGDGDLAEQHGMVGVDLSAGHGQPE
jgi:hypothetical protein